MTTPTERLREYFEAQKENLRRTLKFEPFAVLMPRVNGLYELAITRMPADQPSMFRPLLLVSHKSFLAAAALIGQAQPDDSSPITRRAIEAVQLAVAIKLDPMNKERWAAYEQRLKRWQAREAGRRPPKLPKPLKVAHPLLNDLMQTWGILSDAAVHLTPEYLDSLRWEPRGERVFLHYFTDEQRTIELEIVTLVGSHVQILRAFDWCVDQALSSTPGWKEQWNELERLGKPYAAKFESR